MPNSHLELQIAEVTMLPNLLEGRLQSLGVVSVGWECMYGTCALRELRLERLRNFSKIVGIPSEKGHGIIAM